MNAPTALTSTPLDQTMAACLRMRPDCRPGERRLSDGSMWTFDSDLLNRYVALTAPKVEHPYTGDADVTCGGRFPGYKAPVGSIWETI